jgi:AbrB family looped-hinge helix DNA binding protein
VDDPAFSRVRAKGQITIPTDVRDAARIQEGTLVSFEVTPEGVLMRPKIVVDAQDAWFWTPEWQAGEREASAQLQAGEGDRYGSDEELLAALDDVDAQR